MLAVTATDDTYNVLHDHALSGSSVLWNDYDPAFPNLTASLVSGPSHGTLNFGSNGSFTYTPNANFAGSDSFSYEATSASGTDQASVTINVINHAPFANDGSASVLHDQTLSSSVTAYDMDGDNLAYSLVSGPAHGTLTFNANGSFTYLAPNGFGADSFTFSVTDGIDTDTGTFTINVINHAPVANDGSETVMHGHALGSTVSAYDMDGDSLTFSLTTATTHGFIFLTTGGSFAYMPQAGYVGPDSFSFSVTDGLETDNGTITINVTNNAPVANDDWDLTYVDETLIGTVTAYDMDGDMLTYSVASGPSHGALTMHPSGHFSYSPETAFYGQDSFNFSASDGIASDTGTFTIQVDQWSGGGGGRPVVSISGSGTIEEDGETTSTFTVTRTGETTDALTVGLAHLPSQLDPSNDRSTSAEADDYTLWVNGVASGLTVTIQAGQPSVTVTVKAVDDTKVEENEGFVIGLTNGTGYIPASSAFLSGVFTIKDDEWRWVEPDGPEPDSAVYQWNDFKTVVRTALPDGTLTGRGSVSVDQKILTPLA